MFPRANGAAMSLALPFHVLILLVRGVVTLTTFSNERNGSTELIPGLLSSACSGPDNKPPCVAYCRNNDAQCKIAAMSVVATCSPEWNKYSAARTDIGHPIPGWSTSISIFGHDALATSMTTSMWTTFSKASEGVVVAAGSNPAGPVTTLTPVYALGRPVPSVIVTTYYPDDLITSTLLSGPEPTCKFNVATWNDNCGQCTLTGGTVDLYFWPPSTAAGNHTSLQPARKRSTVLNGTTLYSPSVYIHLRTVYASDSCFQIGARHTSTLLAMDPEDVSTQVHWGGKVAQSGAEAYNTLDYADIVGLPPVSAYEHQPSCLIFGCSTIYPSSWDPVLVVPTQLRAIDPAWQSCAVGLDGLYDPPVALTPQAVVAAPTAFSTPSSVPKASVRPIVDPSMASKTVEPLRTTQPEPTSQSAGGSRPTIASSLDLSHSSLRTTTVAGSGLPTLVSMSNYLETSTHIVHSQKALSVLAAAQHSAEPLISSSVPTDYHQPSKALTLNSLDSSGSPGTRYP